MGILGIGVGVGVGDMSHHRPVHITIGISSIAIILNESMLKELGRGRIYNVYYNPSLFSTFLEGAGKRVTFTLFIGVSQTK